jgi:hypothetical protein
MHADVGERVAEARRRALHARGPFRDLRRRQETIASNVDVFIGGIVLFPSRFFFVNVLASVSPSVEVEALS